MVTCSNCGDEAEPLRWRDVSQEAAMLHDMLYGGGMFIAPGRGYMLPLCGACAERTGAPCG